jgi:serine acetyltransferase
MIVFKEDVLFNRRNFKGLFFIIFFRLVNYIQKANFFFKILGLPLRVIYKFLFRWLLGIDIPDTTVIGKGFMVFHGQSLIIHKDCLIGDNVLVRHNTTIGQAKNNGKVPVIGDNVEIGSNTVIIGDITIGNNCIIAAGSIVIKDVPENVIVAGNPARVVKNLI